jgi:hypothetical protein
MYHPSHELPVYSPPTHEESPGEPIRIFPDIELYSLSPICFFRGGQGAERLRHSELRSYFGRGSVIFYDLGPDRPRA